MHIQIIFVDSNPSLGSLHSNGQIIPSFRVVEHPSLLTFPSVKTVKAKLEKRYLAPEESKSAFSKLLKQLEGPHASFALIIRSSFTLDLIKVRGYHDKSLEL